MNLHKSEDGWRRFRDRTQSGLSARRAFMDHDPTERIRRFERTARFSGRRAVLIAG